MRIAVASDGLDVAKHFSQCSNINYYTTRSLVIAESKNVPTEGFGCDEYIDLMDNIGVDAVICGQISSSCRTSFEDLGIIVEEGASGNALQAAQDFADKFTQQVEAIL